jgi:branched-chain amino acid transport system ATP-binding protein
MLLVRDLTKYFGGLLALDSLSFEVNKGDIVGLIGPNGAGKTTVFNLVTGYYRPTTGKIVFEGKEITGKQPSYIAELGLIRTFQSDRLFNNQTCFESVMLAHHLQRKSIFSNVLNTPAGRDEDERIRSHTEELLERTGLSEVKNKVAGSLPHGLKRILGVAIAIATGPKLILLDEPITGMAHFEIGAMMSLIQRLNREGLTVLLVEHNMKIINICNRVIILNFGKKIAECTPDEIGNNKEVVEAYLGA